MQHRHTTRRVTIAVTAAVTALAGIGLGTSTASAAPGVTVPDQAAPAALAGHQRLAAGATDKLTDELQAVSGGTQRVFVELALAGAADAADAARSQGTDAATSAVNQKAAVAATADAVVAAAVAADADAEPLFEVSNAVPGIGLSATKEALETLAARPDVVKISALVPKTVNNAGAAQLTEVLKTWQDTGTTGRGVTIGIIDTGIDYTHADFGGPGTVEAYEAAQAAGAPFVPTAKVVGGWDFVGDDYNADPTDPTTYQPVPQPDDNPLDCEGHGTHVAGTAAGVGVTADGSAFTGDYAALTGDDLYGMRIGPGMAPEASLYALRVFGCAGSTDVVIPALDRALDPNGDGDFSDHLDIVNLSLGSDYTPVDDPENTVIDRLAIHGVLSVLAAGNAGDVTDVGGSPGNAIRGLGVASSVDQYQVLDGLRVSAPADVAGDVAGQVSAAYPWATALDVSGTVVALTDPANADGCSPLSAADTALVAGKVAWLEWDDVDATRRCGSVGRAANVAAAGATGAIFTSAVTSFGAGITGSDVIPVFQLTGAATAQLRPALASGTLSVTFTASLLASVQDIQPALSDTLSTFSSRGTHGSLGVVKPDVAAPGQSVFSAAVGSGVGGVTESGTSMATPLTAGIAALVASTHPEWNPEQLKAAVMNTATHDVFTGENRTGDRYGPARVGAGRVDAFDAVDTSLLAYNANYDGAVSASFGVVEVSTTRSSLFKSRTVLVENTGATAADIAVSYDSAVEQPGVSYQFEPSRLTVPAGGSARVKVIMKVLPAQLRKTLDPTMSATQFDALTGLDLPRQYVSDASGWLVLTPVDAPVLRVPVYGAAKPSSATRTKVVGSGADGSYLSLRGRGVDQGEGSTAFTSLVSVLDLGYESPRLPLCSTTVVVNCAQNASARSGDLHWVGAGSTRSTDGSLADGWLYFGFSTYRNWATVGHTSIPYVDFDTTGDGVPDYEAAVQYSPDTDIPMAFLYDLADGTLIDVQPINFAFGDVDTNIFDGNVALIPVWPALIGVTDDVDSFPITYTVSVDSYLATSATGTLDRTPPVTFDVARPRIQVASPLWEDQGGTNIPFTLSTATAGTQATDGAAVDSRTPGARATKALVLHLQGATNRRSEVVTIR